MSGGGFLRLAAWILLFGLAAFWTLNASHAQDDNGKQGGKIGADDGDKIQAEAQGKKSKTVTASDLPVLDLSGLPATTYSQSHFESWDSERAKGFRFQDVMTDIRRKDPAYADRIEKELKQIPYLRDCVVYLEKQNSKMTLRHLYNSSLAKVDHVWESEFFKPEEFNRTRFLATATDVLASIFKSYYNHTLKETFGEAPARALKEVISSRYVSYYDATGEYYEKKREQFRLKNE